MGLCRHEKPPDLSMPFLRRTLNMSETLIEMTKDLVLAQIAARSVTPETLSSVLSSTYQTLRQLHSTEVVDAAQPGQGLQPHAGSAKTSNWKASITKHTVQCLECGATFRQLSRRHLQQHELDPRSYRVKYGIPLGQALSAREVTIRRRELAKDIRPWEQARTAKLVTKQAREGSNGTAEPQAKPAGGRKRAGTKA